jgi:hypothetical protein
VKSPKGVGKVASVSVSTGNPVVFLSGEIDMATAQALRSSVELCVRAGGPVIIDFSAVHTVLQGLPHRLTAADGARMFCVQTRTVYSWVDRGLLPARQMAAHPP